MIHDIEKGDTVIRNNNSSSEEMKVLLVTENSIVWVEDSDGDKAPFNPWELDIVKKYYDKE
jgi:hypothetical protein